METRPMKNWWFLLFNGLIAAVFGLILMIYTRETVETAFSFFGIIMLVTGLVVLVLAIRGLGQDRRVALQLFQAVLSIGLGVFLMIAPEHSLKIIMILIGIWGIVLGVVQLVILVNIRQNLANGNLFLFNALLTLAIGIVMFFNPLGFAVFLVKAIGFLTFLFGLILMYLSFIVRKVSKDLGSAGEK